MKHLRILGLLPMAAASLMAFASSASATAILTSPAGTEYTGTIHATLEKGSSTITKFGVENTCTASTIHGIIEINNTTHAAGSLTETATSGENLEPTGWHWGEPGTTCSQDTKTIKAGSLTINDKGEVFAIGNRVEVKVTSLGITCFYGAETGSVKIGTFTGGTPAKVVVNTTTLQRLKGSNEFFCAKEGSWTGNFVVTAPSTLLAT